MGGGHYAGEPGLPAWGDGVDAGLASHSADITTLQNRMTATEGVANGATQTSDRPVSLHGLPGIDWTGATDSSAAVQDAINAAGASAKIDLGKGGRIRCDTGLTLMDFQTLEGPVLQIGTGVPAGVEFDFSNLPASAVGITGGVNNTLRNIMLRGPGYTASGQKAFSASSTAPRFENVQVYSWPTGISLTGAYYSMLTGCEIVSCAVGLSLSGCYDLDLYKVRFRCSNEARTIFGQGIATGTVRGMNVFGGSIEDFGGAGGINVGADSNVNLFGTYFESSVSGAAGIGITSTSSGSALGLYGCMVYLTNLNRWVNFGGGTAQSLVASGNKFSGDAAGTTTPYAYTLSSTGTADVWISGDNWYDVAKGIYQGGTVSLPAAKVRISPPIGATGAGIDYMGLIALTQQAAQADTTGATLTQLETEVNNLKAKLRTLGLMAP